MLERIHRCPACGRECKRRGLSRLENPFCDDRACMADRMERARPEGFGGWEMRKDGYMHPVREEAEMKTGDVVRVRRGGGDRHDMLLAGFLARVVRIDGSVAYVDSDEAGVPQAVSFRESIDRTFLEVVAARGEVFREVEGGCSSCGADLHPDRYRGHNPWCRQPRDPRDEVADVS